MSETWETRMDALFQDGSHFLEDWMLLGAFYILRTSSSVRNDFFSQFFKVGRKLLTTVNGFKLRNGK
jgi:hypothetical protein